MVRFYAVVNDGADVNLARAEIARHGLSIRWDMSTNEIPGPIAIEVNTDTDRVLGELRQSGHFREIYSGQERSLRLPQQE